MKRESQEQPCQKSACVDHQWQPLFHEPSCQENVLAYMTYGLADFKLCSRCGAVGMAEGSSSHKVHLLSDGFAERKKREAAAWNAKQLHDATTK